MFCLDPFRLAMKPGTGARRGPPLQQLDGEGPGPAGRSSSWKEAHRLAWGEGGGSRQHSPGSIRRLLA